MYAGRMVDQHMLSLYLCKPLAETQIAEQIIDYTPFIINRLDNEAQCWTDAVYVLAHNPLDYGCLASIVKATVGARCQRGPKIIRRVCYSIRIRISLSFNLAFLNIDSILSMYESGVE